ncbi:MAG: hypothetical protein HY036_06960 [Nitrospirae bacterium]|nr:hypothetical protein [Nitrospirota bacterium]MBI3352302.1 hypothetical protein [Nitrospirota bacterium]
MKINKRIVSFLLFIAILCSVPAWAGQGWYLMYPPLKSQDPDSYLFYQFDSEAPLTKWEHVESFERVEDCKRYKGSDMDMVNHEIDCFMA